MLSALVLAAGTSKRMGTLLKALLPVNGRTFLEKIVDDLSRTECGELIVVLGAEREKILERTVLSPARVVINEDWESGQLSSLRAGIRECAPERRGHPALFPHALYSRLLYDPLPDGARGVFRDGKSPLRQIEVNDPGILLDIDTLQDYKRYVGEL
jgi:molybdenum cofactor cytidylyltransferase